jgi:hypothetical protein
MYSFRFSHKRADAAMPNTTCCSVVAEGTAGGGGGYGGGDGVEDVRLLLLVLRWEAARAVAMPVAVARSSGEQTGVERMAWRV